MKLWLLRPRDDLADDNNPWKPLHWYDRCFGLVVRAESEEDARRFADENHGNENDFTPDENGNLLVCWYDSDKGMYSERVHPWLMPRFSTCEELRMEGKPGVIIQDIRYA